MPNRILRDGINDSQQICGLSEGAELFYRRLMSLVDDFGRYEADVGLLQAKLFHLGKRKKRSLKHIQGFLDECTSGKRPLITLYEHEDKSYLQINHFGQRERTSRYPGPPNGDGGPGVPGSGSPGPIADKCAQMPPNAAHARATNTTTNTPPTATKKEEGLGETETDDPTEIIHRTLAGIVPNHPKSSPLPWAVAAVEREVASNHLDAKEFCEALKKTHVEHCKIYERELAENPRAFVPLFHKWVSDGYYLHRPSNRDPPIKKPSYAQAVAAGLVTNLEEYERRFHA